MLDEMMWQGIETGYRRLAASWEDMAAYQAEAAELVGQPPMPRLGTA